MEKNKKQPKAPSDYSDKRDTLENKDRKKSSNLKAADQTAIGEHEFEEDRSPEIRMKPQPFNKKKDVPDRETDGI